MKAIGRTKTHPVSRRTSGVPERALEVEQTREIPAVTHSSEGLPSAAPQQLIPVEETVSFQSCIERTLQQELLRRQSAEEDEDHKSGKVR
jgi:hypothetical protein